MITEVELATGHDDPSVEVDQGSDPFAMPAHSVLKWTAVAVTSLAILCLRNIWVFSIPLHEDSDYAANSILVNQAHNFQLLVGNYSREGFNHPGPAFLYIQSFGQDLFFAFGHIVPSQYNGQLVGVFVLNSVIIAMVASVLARHARSWVVAIVTLAVVLLMMGSTGYWSSAWMPYLYVAPFLLAVVAGVSVAVGALGDLPIFALAVCLLIHGHVAFIGIMGIYVLIVSVACVLTSRRLDGWRDQLRSHRRPVVLSAVVVVLFAVPIVMNLVLHWPGQWKLYWDYAHTNGHKNVHTFGQVVDYVERYWPGGHRGLLALALAGIAALIVAAMERNRNRRLFLLGLLAAVVVVTLETAGYAFKGVDVLSLAYTGYFYYTVPPLIVAVLVLELGCLLRGALTRWRPGWARGTVPICVLAVVASAGLYLLASQPSFYNPYRGDSALPRMAASVEQARARQDRAVAIDLAAPGALSADWPDVVGLLVAASRQGFQPCIANPAWKFMMTSQYICTASQTKQRWRITVDLRTTPLPPGSQVIFRDGKTVVFTH